MNRRSLLTAGFIAPLLLLAPTASSWAQEEGQRTAEPPRSAQVFPSWPYGARTAKSIAPGVALLTTWRWEILLTSPSSYERIPKDEAVTRVLSECRDSLRLSSDEIASLKNARPWFDYDSVTRSMSGLSIAIAPRAVNIAGCAQFMATHPGLVARGMRLVEGPPSENTKYMLGAEVLVDGQPVRAIAYQRAQMPFGSSPTVRVDTAPQVRMFVPIEALVPLHGAYPSVDLRISMTDGTRAERIELPTDAIDVVWNALLAERIARSVDDSVRTPIEVPEPRDRVLRDAWSLIRSGRSRQGSALQFRRLGESGVSLSDQRSALLQLSATLRANGDTAASRVVAARLTSLSPCLTLSSRMPGDMRALVEESRPPTRCDSAHPEGVLLSGAIIPGLGQMRTGHSTIGRIVLASTVLLAGASAASLHNANAAYTAYQNSRSVEDAISNFGHATGLRHQALALGTAAGLAWAGAAIQAAYVEWRHGRVIDHARNYGGGR